MRSAASWKRTLFLMALAALFSQVESPAGPSLEGVMRAQRPAGVAGTVVVPDQLLRRWDPLTIFFARDVGPAKGGPEDQPERVVKLNPDQPGAWEWIDARTLQLRPTVPWQPFSHYTIQADGKAWSLATLLEPPISSLPAAGTEGLTRVESLTLTFADPLEVQTLASMVQLELRPLPGADGGEARWLKGDDFTVKPLERDSVGSSASYVLSFKQPLPEATRAIVHFRLSQAEQAQASFYQLSFATAVPFRVESLGCAEASLPLSPGGSRFTKEQALRCGSQNPVVRVGLTAPMTSLNPLHAQSFLRIEPPVSGLTYALDGKVLEARGAFVPDTLYRAVIYPAPLTDSGQRLLDMQKPSEVWLYFPRSGAWLQWGASQGIVERFGPQRVPLEGRGVPRADVRVYTIPATSRSFWPFPETPVVVDETRRPPGPGEAPEPFAEVDESISTDGLARQIASLGSPPVSTLVSLPLPVDGQKARFGLDVEPYLTRLVGKQKAGTFLVGLRRLDGSSYREWIRIQVTDLSLSVLEEPDAVTFLVTSLASGAPVPGATVRVEGSEPEGESRRWASLFQGVTDASGQVRFKAPGGDGDKTVYRLQVQKADDILVLDTRRPPDAYQENHWGPRWEGGWLQWAFQDHSDRLAPTPNLSHVFTERPVYRPEEAVHIKGYLRSRSKGRLSLTKGAVTVVVSGPGELHWEYPLELTPLGGFYQRFAQPNLPTGTYTVQVRGAQQAEDGEEETLARTSFRMEAYRIPRFEVQLQAPERTPLDGPFSVSLTASYYAGGRVAGRPVRWRATQFPYTWAHNRLPGFHYSSDGRYSRLTRFESTPALERQEVTDREGQSRLELNPALEPTAQPRTYTLEATVTGDDDQTVTATRSVIALPAFVLGVKVPRYVEKTTSLTPEVLALGPDGKPLAGKTVTVRLLQRQWHSVLQTGDFVEGVARYLTDVVDEKVSETTVVSGVAPVAVPLSLPKAGVYVVELEARDKLGRAQVVSVDFFAGGEGAVAWQRSSEGVFTLVPDKEEYQPGEQASLVLQSPFQSAEALVMVESPDGNLYSRVKVSGGRGVVKVPLAGHYAPRVPVHVLLMRGRVPGVLPANGATVDLGKPATVAATTYLNVVPTDNRVEVSLEHASKARPGETLPVTIRLKTPQGKPLAGEVTLWLVDAAVLALGQEKRLDPLPDFITRVDTRMRLRDTRNLTFGYLPMEVSPGGDEGEDDESDVLDRATVRRNFQPVPYFAPAIPVGSDGVARVQVKLSDDLTLFKLRAKAVAGPERFGFATSQVSVRLPLIVQPNLPRFVRPGDRFLAEAIGRVVEGGGGPGSVVLKAEGLEVEGAAARKVQWNQDLPERVGYQVSVPVGSPSSGPGAQVRVKVGVERLSDKALDAFEVSLPIREDRSLITRSQLLALEAGKPVSLTEIPEARAGSVRRTLLMTGEPRLLRLAAGVDTLRRYPYGCTEQRLALARGYLATRALRDLLHLDGPKEELDRAVIQTIAQVANSLDGDGLVAYWPGTRGYVSLSAWALDFLTSARKGGYRVDEGLYAGLQRTLQKALRSDYARFVDGASYAERAMALSALARAGRFEAGYAAELARRAQYLDQEGLAEVLMAFAEGGQAGEPVVQELAQGLLNSLNFRLFQGREIFAGLQDRGLRFSGLILPGETRTLARVARALARFQPGHARLPVLLEALETLGQGNGWGSTNADAAALEALSEGLQSSLAAPEPQTVEVKLGSEAMKLSIGPQAPVAWLEATRGGTAVVQRVAGTPSRPVVIRATASYLPAADGSQLGAEAEGFVVSRTLLKLLGGDAPPEKIRLEQGGSLVRLEVGQVVEEQVQVVNPEERHYVAVVVPLAAGMEPLNPALATAPPEATPRGRLTLQPTYVAFLDDKVAWYYNTLPKGTYDFAFRARATFTGTWLQPGASSELMYQSSVRGASPGARIQIERSAP